MNQSWKLYQHYLVLAGIIVLGTALRFWNLDLKPLWLDEVLTALFSLGRNYNDLPLDVVFPLSKVREILTLKPGVSCREIANNLAIYSTHPPLFFCLMYSWLNLTGVERLIWGLRSLPALIGVAGIVAVYCLNRLAFSKPAALMATALMAVSPFAVYLSQEARHYTLPMLLITLALLGLIQIQDSFYFQQQQPKPIVWLGWGIVNSIGCYIHYFFILAFTAQILTLIGLMYLYRQRLPRYSWITVILVILGVAVSYLPWLSVLLVDVGRQETDWLPQPENIVPLLQLFVGNLLMVIALPVEDQPWWVAVPMGLFMIGFGGWVGWQGWRGVKQIFQQDSTQEILSSNVVFSVFNYPLNLLSAHLNRYQLGTVTVGGFIIGVLLQFWAIIYLLGKDISVVPRYNFVYYPALCALLGSSLSFRQDDSRKWQTIGILFISLLSTILVIYNLVFLKPFHPFQVAESINQEPAVPMLMVISYNDLQDVALGLSFALALDGMEGGINQRFIAFLNRQQGYNLVEPKLSDLSISSVSNLNLSLIAPRLKRRDYPQQLTLNLQRACTINLDESYRLRRFAYQLYRCN